MILGNKAKSHSPHIIVLKHLDTGRLHYSGLQTCGSVWSYPNCKHLASLCSSVKNADSKRKLFLIDLPPRLHTFRLGCILTHKNIKQRSCYSKEKLPIFRFFAYFPPRLHTFRLGYILFRLGCIKLPPRLHKTPVSLAYKICFLFLKINSIYKNKYYVTPATKANLLYLGYLHTFRLVYIPYNYNNKTIYKNNVRMPKLCLI
jgi:hypothetical protein